MQGNKHFLNSGNVNQPYRVAIPLIPKCLRELWSEFSLPMWVARQLGITRKMTFADLDHRVWSNRLEQVPAGVRSFLVNFVNGHLDDIIDMQVFSSFAVPDDVDSIGFSVRTRNCLKRGGLMQCPDRWLSLTFRDLYSIRSMGTTSVLEFACRTEAFSRGQSEFNFPVHSSNEQTVSTRECVRLRGFDDAWLDQVSFRDTRFRDLFPHDASTLRQLIIKVSPKNQGMLDAHIESIVDRAREIEKMSLENALEHFVHSTAVLDPDKTNALLSRLGWLGLPPTTLQEAADSIGVTRERIRQIQKEFYSKLPNHPIFMPALDKAIKLIMESLPLSCEEASRLISEEGISQRPFEINSLLAVAKSCKRGLNFKLEEQKHLTIVGTKEDVTVARRLVTITRKQCGASGVSSVLAVKDELSNQGFDVTEDYLQKLLVCFKDVRFLYRDWFWIPNVIVARNRLRNVTRKMLSVVPSLSIGIAREGVKREYKFRRFRGRERSPLVVPPVNVLRKFYKAHEEFLVEGDLVHSALQLDYKLELSKTEIALVEELRRLPGGLSDRASLQRTCIKSGMNENTFTVYLFHSPVIAHVGQDLWSIRGWNIEAVMVEAIRNANANRKRTKRVLGHGWTESGKVWIGVLLPEYLSGFLFSIPSSIKSYIFSTEYSAKLNGEVLGNLKVNEKGVVFGIPPLLKRDRIHTSTVLVIEFDIRDAEATMYLAARCKTTFSAGLRSGCHGLYFR